MERSLIAIRELDPRWPIGDIVGRSIFERSPVLADSEYEDEDDNDW
jgi:hypothetical protein